MQQPLISVIIPVYKVEAYLKRCVDSVICQTYKNLQIILVEDGSPDTCGEICEEYQKADSRITVIHQENRGLSAARNTGITEARGEYLAFVDSDDYVAEEFIEKLYRACMETDSQVGICGYIEDSGEENLFLRADEVKNHPKESDRGFSVCSEKELQWNMYEEYHKRNTEFVVTWNKLYHKSLWQDVRFPEGRIHEDEATTYRIYAKCSRGVYLPNPYYVYFQGGKSITRQRFQTKRLDWFTALEERIAFFDRRGEADLALQACKAYMDASIRFSYRFQKETENGKELLALCRKNVWRTLKAGSKYGRLPYKTGMGYMLFLCCPALYYKVCGYQCNQ